MLARRSPLRDLCVLTILCAAVYAVFPTRHGLTNWQESKRAIVAREMHDRLRAGEPYAWLIPTDHGSPYLAKPPMMYWAQIALATLRRDRCGELDLRLTVAIAGWLGVLATYLAARRLLGPWDEGPEAVLGEELAFGDHTAWWSALMLATGVLYVRSSRIGELDILLVPFTVAAVGLVARAWRRTDSTGRTAWRPLILATLATTGAALTKGPPAVLAIAAAAYGGVAWYVALKRTRPRPRLAPAPDAVTTKPAAPSALARILPAVGGLGLAFFSAVHAASWKDAPGVIAMGVLGSVFGLGVSRLAARARLFELWSILSRTHPVMVVGIPLLVYFGWQTLATRLAGTGSISGSLGEEVEDNLRVLVPASPIINAEAMAYGVGLGSIAAIIAAFWLWRDRPKLSKAWPIVMAWVGLGYFAFSTLGKGVPRYLTPVWPGVAILGGTWLVSFLRDHPMGRWLKHAVLALVLALAAGQAWWYAIGREEKFAARSPRALIESLRAEGAGADLAQLCTFEFSTPAIDFYAGRAVESFLNSPPRPGLRFVGPRTLVDLKKDLADGSSRVMLIRTSQPPGMDGVLAFECLSQAGLVIDPIPGTSPFTIDNGRVPVIAVRIRAPSALLPDERPD